MNDTAAAFYFDLASPLAYLAAERILHVLARAPAAPAPVQWQPVLARELAGADAWEAFRCETEREVFRGELERRARELGLQPLRWPEPFPFDSSLAMRVATYAASIGRTVPFAQAAFRQAFAGGHSLADVDHVLIAAAACEMHPRAVLQGAELDTVGQRLARTTAAAREAGVVDVPAVTVGSEVFCGERELERAAAYMRDERPHAAGAARATAATDAATSVAPAPADRARARRR